MASPSHEGTRVHFIRARRCVTPTHNSALYTQVHSTTARAQAATGAVRAVKAVLAKAKPKVVTIVRSGPKPHSTVKILLNRRSVQSFKQLMKDIAEAFGVKSKTNRVRRLYNIRGREVMSVSDFFPR